MECLLYEFERDELRGARDRHRAESAPHLSLRERARAPRTRTEMRDRYEMLG